MLLFQDEFSDYINAHLKRTYLDPKRPENLGGRAAGIQATSSSSNGVEKRGGNYKTKTSCITQAMPESGRNNFIYVMEGKTVMYTITHVRFMCAIAHLRVHEYTLLTNAQLRSNRN